MIRVGGTTPVSVTSVGDITATYAGISAFSTQSDGDLTVQSTGDIMATTGINAVLSTNSNGDVSVTSSGTLDASDFCIRARAQNDGVTVNNTGDITAGNYGIYASSLGTGTVAVTNNGNVEAAQTAIYAKSTSGIVTIQTTGDITSTGGHRHLRRRRRHEHRYYVERWHDLRPCRRQCGRRRPQFDYQ